MTPDASGPTPKPTPKKVFDVMKPGKAMASPSSRPIIVGHKQVHDSVSGVGTEGPSLQHKRKIELIHHDSPEDAAPKDESTAAVAKPSEEQSANEAYAPEAKPPVHIASVAAKSEVAVPSLPAASEPTEPQPQPKTEESDSMAPVFDTPSPQAQAMPPAPETKLAFDDTPAPIPDNQEIIVSHHGALDEPFKVIGLLLLIIVLAAVALDILLDAGVLSIDAIPHTNFLK